MFCRNIFISFIWNLEKPWIVNIKDIDPLFQVCVLHEFPAIGFCLLKKVKNIFYIFPLTFNGINKNVVKTTQKRTLDDEEETTT